MQDYCTSGQLPWVSTVYSTTTTTYWVTSTIYVDPTPAPEQKREPKFLPQRDIWCSDYGMPCRLAQYTPEVVFQACIKYLGGGKVVTTTSTKSQTVTATATGCT